MAHLPINHHLQPLFRTLAGLSGLYVLVFGCLAVVQTRGLAPFAQEDLPRVMLLQANGAFASLSIAAGIIVVGAAVIGGNLDHWVNLVGGGVFLVAGMAMLTVLRTDLNLLGFAVSTCIASFIIGLVLLTAGLFGKTGSTVEADREERFRHSRRL